MVSAGGALADRAFLALIVAGVSDAAGFVGVFLTNMTMCYSHQSDSWKLTNLWNRFNCQHPIIPVPVIFRKQNCRVSITRPGSYGKFCFEPISEFLAIDVVRFVHIDPEAFHFIEALDVELRNLDHVGMLEARKRLERPVQFGIHYRRSALTLVFG